MPGSATRANALDHVVVVLFENRSLDNVLGRLYGPGDGKAFEGVIGKELSNPIPGWDEPGGTYDHVPPGPVPPPDPAAPAGEFGFTFDRSGYRVPAIVVSPWVEPGPVYNEEYRHTSLIATLRKAWDLGVPFTRRDAAARTFDHVFTRGTPRDPQTWATVAAQPLPAWAIDYQTMGNALGYLGKDVASGIIEHARQMGVNLPPQLDDPSAELTPQLIVEVIRDVAFHYFPRLAPGDTGDSH
jgi:phospholipase C